MEASRQQARPLSLPAPPILRGAASGPGGFDLACVIPVRTAWRKVLRELERKKFGGVVPRATTGQHVATSGSLVRSQPTSEPLVATVQHRWQSVVRWLLPLNPRQHDSGQVLHPGLLSVTILKKGSFSRSGGKAIWNSPSRMPSGHSSGRRCASAALAADRGRSSTA